MISQILEFFNHIEWLIPQALNEIELPDVIGRMGRGGKPVEQKSARDR
jgi:hypothetical protein